MDDLVERLRRWSPQILNGDAHNAADEIERLNHTVGAYRVECDTRLHEIDRLIAERDDLRKEVEALRADAASKQARIDALMLEYCPEEMTHVQIAEWERHQRKLSPEEQACIDALTGDAAMNGKGAA